jgi:two-component system, chemotaxis family, protein-glutamate methylesterase/glutaminase
MEMFKRDVIVIGASAGGVEALSELVKALPPDFPAAVFVVLHIPAHSPSQLHKILSRSSQLPVVPAGDGDEIVPSRIYIAPPDRHMMCEEKRIRLTRGPKENRFRPAVDVLFRSAAFTFGPRAIGVVLSGMLDDGTAGLWSVKDRGGVAIVQSLEDSRYASMPESALKHVTVDHVVPAAQMAHLLGELTRKPVAFQAPTQPRESLDIENRIALEGNGLKLGVMRLGPISPNTCPECHGVLVKINEGPIVRFRCHTGHSYSLQTLLADVNLEIDKTLWSAVRAIEERILLLQEASEQIKNEDKDLGGRALRQAQDAERQVKKIRDILLGSETLGHLPQK